MPPDEEDARRRLQELRVQLLALADDMHATSMRIDRAIRESDRRAEEYLPILRRAGLVPRRRSWWL